MLRLVATSRLRHRRVEPFWIDGDTLVVGDDVLDARTLARIPGAPPLRKIGVSELRDAIVVSGEKFPLRESGGIIESILALHSDPPRALTVLDERESQGLWLWSFDRAPRRLANAPRFGRAAAFSPDARRIAWQEEHGVRVLSEGKPPAMIEQSGVRAVALGQNARTAIAVQRRVLTMDAGGTAEVALDEPVRVLAFASGGLVAGTDRGRVLRFALERRPDCDEEDDHSRRADEAAQTSASDGHRVTRGRGNLRP